jgi:hypothetical protein
MKRFLAVVLVLFSTAAMADWHGHGMRHGGYRGGNDWIAPMILGGVVTYAITRPAPPPPQVVYVPTPAPVQQMPPYGYHYEQLVDASCNCYRVVLVPN